MDPEDLDHFKTIASASARQTNASDANLSKEKSNSPHDPVSCTMRAKAIFGSYRRDEAHDPDVFVAALALVLGDFPSTVVDYAADPRTGIITKFPMGLPNVGQIKQFLDDTLAKQERLNHYATLPKPKSIRHDKPPISEPNLFVPDTSNRYQAMVKRADAEPERARYGTQRCSDGVTRSGVFVPLDWWEEPGNISEHEASEVSDAAE